MLQCAIKVLYIFFILLLSSLSFSLDDSLGIDVSVASSDN